MHEVKLPRLGGHLADITYPPTAAGSLSLAVVLDALSRRVAGRSMAPHRRTEPVLDAPETARAHRRPPAGLIHHADRGCRYTSLASGAHGRDAGIAPSMGSVGDCYDDAPAESVCAAPEREPGDHVRRRTHAEARMAVLDSIEGSCNPRRRHSALAYLRPADFERRYRLAAAA